MNPVLVALDVDSAERALALADRLSGVVGGVKVGSLIGLRREEGTAFGAGVVRRIVFDEKKNCYLGIELLAAGGTAVTILPASMSAKGSAIPPQGELCILMATGAANIQRSSGSRCMLRRSIGPRALRA